ncbi:MAG TPA: Sec-independent protein translocase protein TatB [Cellvibrio sp.]|nr:Sec-independent protein translocase protein TatB [Cellvibrio sp.]
MFDIGFSELLVCLVVALVVIGPERLPETVRTVGLWIGRLKRSLRDTRSEIERQIGADEIRRQLHNEEIMERIEQTRIEMERTLQQAALTAPPQDQPRTYEHVELPDHAHMNEQPVAATEPAPTEAAVSSDTSTKAPTQTS